ncbi:MAG: hypothetical protein ACI8RZ_006920 [Myxococcota bacterium]|jgi:hypothetical protein
MGRSDTVESRPMGILGHSSTPRILTLPSHGLVGRSPACVVRLADRRVSSEHARIQWTAEGWTLRDLSSRNGTLLNGTFIEPGLRHTLSTGDVLAFGGEAQAWTLLDAAAPVATGRELATGRILTARDGLLRFPGDSPFPYVCSLAPGRFILESEYEQRTVADGEVITIGEQHWMLHLPIVMDETELSEARPRHLSRLRWHFAVSSDEEFVEVTVHDGDEVIPLGSRAHHYMLLTLARHRQTDNEGWLYTDELCRMLGVEENHLNVQIFRAREELGRANVMDAANIIERRKATRQLRIDIADPTIVRSR